MFTGIIRAICSISSVDASFNFMRYSVIGDSSSLASLQKGASVSIDGVCQTVVDIDGNEVWFEAIGETLSRTTLKSLKRGDPLNFERAACFGDEIGGHILSGHVFGTAFLETIARSENNCVLTLRCRPEWCKYLFPKGYIALNGASLTLVDVLPAEGLFTVHLIPETLKRTTFSIKQIGDSINVEFDSFTQTIVDTLERVK